MSIGPLLKVVTILLFWALCAHWVACGWFFIGWATCGQYSQISASSLPNTETSGSREDSEQCYIMGSACMGNWVTEFWRGSPIAELCIEGGEPTVAASTAGVTIASMHVRALGWALATMSAMGYGRAPVAISDLDYIYSFGAQVLGACLAAAIFSNIAALINKGDAGAARYQEQLQKVNEFIRLYKLPPDARRTLLDYHELLFSAYRGFDLKQVANMLPKHLQKQVYYKLHKNLLLQVPAFEGCHVSFIEQLILELGTQVLLAGDFAFRKDDLGELMYFLQFGSIEIGNIDMSVIYVTKETGSFFGEIAIFSNQRRTASARGKSDSILYTLSKAGFESVAVRFPDSYKMVYEKTNENLRKVCAANKAVETKACSVAAVHSKGDSHPCTAPSSKLFKARISPEPEQRGTGASSKRRHSDTACPPRQRRFSFGPTAPKMLTSSPPPTPPAVDTSDGAEKESTFNLNERRSGPQLHIPAVQTKRLPIFHEEELASLPPSSLAPLYSGQALDTLRTDVLPIIHMTNQSVDALREEVRKLAAGLSTMQKSNGS